MSEKNSASLGTKSVPVVVQESVFNAGIILTDSNYDVRFQIMEMHIAEWKKLSTSVGRKRHLQNQMIDMRIGTLRIKKSRDGY